MATITECELVIKAESRAPGERDYVAVLGNLIREYEEAHISVAPLMTPQRALESLLEDNQLTQSELARQLKAPQSVFSEFLAGKRGLSKTLVLRLADYFKVSPQLFLPKSLPETSIRRSLGKFEVTAIDEFSEAKNTT